MASSYLLATHAPGNSVTSNLTHQGFGQNFGIRFLICMLRVIMVALRKALERYKMRQPVDARAKHWAH